MGGGRDINPDDFTLALRFKFENVKGKGRLNEACKALIRHG